MYEHSGPYWGLDKAVSLIKQLTTAVNKRNKYLTIVSSDLPFDSNFIFNSVSIIFSIWKVQRA